MWKGTSASDVYRPSVLRCHVDRKNQETISYQAVRIHVTHLWAQSHAVDLQGEIRRDQEDALSGIGFRFLLKAAISRQC